MRRVTCNLHNEVLHLDADRDPQGMFHPSGTACHSTTFSVSEVVPAGYAWGVLMSEVTLARMSAQQEGTEHDRTADPGGA